MGRSMYVTGAWTRASSGWNRGSLVGRSEKISIRSPAASRARISETMNVSEKRGYIFRTYAVPGSNGDTAVTALGAGCGTALARPEPIGTHQIGIRRHPPIWPDRQSPDRNWPDRQSPDRNWPDRSWPDRNRPAAAAARRPAAEPESGRPALHDGGPPWCRAGLPASRPGSPASACRCRAAPGYPAAAREAARIRCSARDCVRGTISAGTGVLMISQTVL